MPVLAGLTAALVALGLLIAQTTFAQQDARRRALAEGNALLALQSLLVTMLDAETSQRGYLLTRKEDYLQPYVAARANRDKALAAVARGVAEAQDGRDAAGRLRQLTDTKLEEIDRTIALSRSGRQNEALSLIDADFGKLQMDAIRSEIAAQATIRAQDRTAAFANAADLEDRLLPLVGVLCLAILALVYAGYRAERSRAHAVAEAAQADALREANERAQLLARELNHRVKNLFSVVLSIVSLSGRKPSPTGEVVEDIRARIRALSLAHTASQGVGEHSRAELRPIVERTMEPYADPDGQRVRIAGPDIDLPVRMVTPIGLIVHELATNAVKYGALSHDGGMVEIRWQVEETGPDAWHVELCWTETGGPKLAFEADQPAASGFGTQMTGLAARQIGGTLEREWPTFGAVARLRFPLDRAGPDAA
ncbi:MAG: CHASE3 domain-containing protein [Novosphingobium sp.]|nr:CHASE3 domain-containing protein [Novosphingobium sp.]